jgi:hypothetical protein
MATGRTADCETWVSGRTSVAKDIGALARTNSWSRKGVWPALRCSGASDCCEANANYCGTYHKAFLPSFLPKRCHNIVGPGKTTYPRRYVTASIAQFLTLFSDSAHLVLLLTVRCEAMARVTDRRSGRRPSVARACCAFATIRGIALEPMPSRPQRPTRA